MLPIRTRSSLLLCLLALALTVSGSAQPKVVDEIAFGSCIKDPNHPMLDRVLTLPMDLFLFLGDNIYADTTNIASMRRKYDALKGSRFFRELRSRVPIMAAARSRSDGTQRRPGHDHRPRLDHA